MSQDACPRCGRDRGQPQHERDSSHACTCPDYYLDPPAWQRTIAAWFKGRARTPLEIGATVRVTLRRSGKGDYTAEAIEQRCRHNGAVGVVSARHAAHGRYGVTFDDGAVAFYDPEELEICDQGSRT